MRWATAGRTWTRRRLNLGRARRQERELHAELQAHLQLHIDLAAGMRPADD